MENINKMQTYLIKKRLISPPMEVPKHIKYFFQNVKTSSLINSEKNEEDDTVATEDMRLVLSNYILLKEIFSNFKTWQELKLVSSVYETWHDVIYNMCSRDLEARHFNQFIQSTFFKFDSCNDFTVEPSYVLVFITSTGYKGKFRCEMFTNNPCIERCKDNHRMLDYVYRRICYPKNVLVAHECIKIIHCPAYTAFPQQIQDTNKHPEYFYNFEHDRCLSGVFFPKIPGVQVLTLKMSSKHETRETQQEFDTKINEMIDSKIVKCALMFRRDFEDSNSLDVLMKISNMQRTDPMAIGGCCIERSHLENFHHCYTHRSWDAVYTFFTVSKNAADIPAEFDVYSKVFGSDCRVESDVVMEMKKMSDAIPRREYSTALKLSCIGRHPKVDILENNLFRKHFPTTYLVGCYGQGELGTDCIPSSSGLNCKRQSDTYVYSTVFVIFMWGKLK